MFNVLSVLRKITMLWKLNGIAFEIRVCMVKVTTCPRQQSLQKNGVRDCLKGNRLTLSNVLKDVCEEKFVYDVHADGTRGEEFC